MTAKVAICFLSGDLIHANFATSLVHLIAHTMGAGIEVTVINTQCTIIADGRNKAIEGAISSGCTHALFVDSDMVFTPDALCSLLARDKNIIGATYMSRRQHPVHGHSLMHRELGVDPVFLGDGVRKVSLMPTGFLLIKLDIFKFLPKPWFWFGYTNPGLEVIGEDYAFCSAVTKLGLDIWMDADVSNGIGHIASVTIYPGMFGHGPQVIPS